jgi:hypothetical protein
MGLFYGSEMAMRHGSSEHVREVALEKYVKPAIRAGKTHFSVAVKDVIQDLASQGFPPANTPQVCTALRKKTFLRKNGIEIEGIDGPPSKTSTTVVYRYRLAKQEGQGENPPAMDASRPQSEKEDSDAWALRVTEKIRGLLKDEFAEYGGGESFLRWVRSENEDEK